ncbi:unnamed protein product [Parajaminaea phylloscopi]
MDDDDQGETVAVLHLDASSQAVEAHDSSSDVDGCSASRGGEDDGDGDGEDDNDEQPSVSVTRRRQSQSPHSPPRSASASALGSSHRPKSRGSAGASGDDDDDIRASFSTDTNDHLPPDVDVGDATNTRRRLRNARAAPRRLLSAYHSARNRPCVKAAGRARADEGPQRDHHPPLSRSTRHLSNPSSRTTGKPPLGASTSLGKRSASSGSPSSEHPSNPPTSPISSASPTPSRGSSSLGDLASRSLTDVLRGLAKARASLTPQRSRRLSPGGEHPHAHAGESNPRAARGVFVLTPRQLTRSAPASMATAPIAVPGRQDAHHGLPRNRPLHGASSEPSSLSISPNSLAKIKGENVPFYHTKRKSVSDLNTASPASGLAASLRASVGPLAGIGLPQMAVADPPPPMLPRFSTDDLFGRPRSTHTPVPTNSILLNPLRRPTANDSTLTASPSPSNHSEPSVAAPAAPAAPLNPAPVVTHIPAVPSEKEIQRQKEKKEREKAREREERERRERETKEAELAMELQTKEEKIWGIPKKAFYLGLGSVPGALNFNAHMAMMAGWGNGSGGSTDFTPPPPRRTSSSASKITTKSNKSLGPGKEAPSPRSNGKAASSTRATSASRPSSSPCATKKPKLDEDSDEEERLDPEELAALNAIINTRRSLAAAQALASGQVKLPAPKRPVRPSYASIRQSSQESVPTRSSNIGKQEDTGTGQGQPTEGHPPSLASKDSYGSASVPEGADESATKIRFAPMPKYSPIDEDPYGNDINAVDEDETISAPQCEDNDDDASSWKALDFFGKRRSSRDSVESESVAADSDVDSDDTNSDEDIAGSTEQEQWKNRASRTKGKWYLMRLPPHALKSSEYYRAWKRWSHEYSAMAPSSHGTTKAAPSVQQQGAGSSSASDARSQALDVPQQASNAARLDDAETGNSPPRGSSVETDAVSVASSQKDEQGQRPRSKRGRRRRLSRPSSSRAASLSGDEEERSRRRQLILSVRPGGTGMVTLPDGTRVKARRVGDAEMDTEELNPDEWGFAGLAGLARGQKAASEQNNSESNLPGSPSGASPKETPDLLEHSGDPIVADANGPQAEGSPASKADESLAEAALSQSGASLQLSLSRAEEVRRRHEAEMAALGAEVLAAHRRKIEQAAANAHTPHGEQALSTYREPTKESVQAHPPLIRLSSRDSSLKDRSPTRVPSLGFKTSLLGRQSQTSLHSLRGRRSSSENRRAIYSPDTSLPRKPDAKGYAVVPLPSELGLRPKRPREGRVWENSDDDDEPVPEEALGSDSDSFDSQAEAVVLQSPVDQSLLHELEDEEDDDLDLNEAEIAEDERRRAVHSKRATTSAAGMERMHVRSRSTSVAPGETRPKVPVRRHQTIDEGPPKRIMSADAGSSVPHAHTQKGLRRRGASLSDTQGQLSRLVLDGAPAYLPTSSPKGLSPSALPAVDSKLSSPHRRDTLLRNAKSSPTIPRGGKHRGHRGGKQRRGLDDDDDDDDLDLELWPSSAALMLGMGSPGKRPPPSVLLAQAHKARLLREKRERELKEAEAAQKKLQEQDEDAIDYGWPPTLKGSLYDR